MKVGSLDQSITRRSSEPVYTRTFGASLFSAWVRSCVIGAMFAVTISALISLLVRTYLAQYRSGAYAVAAVELVAVASALEGALIGYFQWRVLRRVFPTMSSRMWVGSTMIAAGSGCLLSWLPTSFALASALAGRIGDVTVGTGAAVQICLVTGALIGLVWGVAQYAVLRLHVHHAGAWISASMIAWSISFGALYLSAFVPDRTASSVDSILLAAGAGLVLGSALGLVHGRVLVALRSRLLIPHASR
jgi:hypothetical protein